MLLTTTNPEILYIPLLIGLLAVLLAIFYESLLRLMGLRPMRELFTIPRFQRSAHINARFARLFLFFFGIGFILQGVGPLLFSATVIETISLWLLGISILLVLGMAGVTLFFWRGS